MRLLGLALVLWAVYLSAEAQRVAVLGCGEPSRDNAYRNMLQAHGLTVAWTLPYYEFEQAALLNTCDVVLLTPLINHYDMPARGQWALDSWVRDGGGLVTVEWTLWSWARSRMFAGLSDLLPAQAMRFTRYQAVVYTMRTYDPILSAGLEASLPLGVLNETLTLARAGATLFYASNYAPNSAGVVGWQVASGRILSFSIAAGAVSPTELEDPTTARLLANAVRWAAGNTCTPSQGDITRDGCVDDADLLTVLFAFGTTGSHSADVNCDHLVDDADLLEVLFQFGTGC
ncbi:MAG: hypothetical protein CFK49_03650 [Armatimonadetes bacterium JP3_11]|jgi:hypothetical protein|nr:MAG: hypothetical protein CFK49_03650 [Armatimonadetes bacterium JP3_11]RMH06194.1 MAG: hypothetical protein D6697_11140 [Armatimonadota bacterium]